MQYMPVCFPSDSAYLSLLRKWKHEQEYSFCALDEFLLGSRGHFGVKRDNRKKKLLAGNVRGSKLVLTDAGLDLSNYLTQVPTLCRVCKYKHKRENKQIKWHF